MQDSKIRKNVWFSWTASHWAGATTYHLERVCVRKKVERRELGIGMKRRILWTKRGDRGESWQSAREWEKEGMNNSGGMAQSNNNIDGDTRRTMQLQSNNNSNTERMARDDTVRRQHRVFPRWSNVMNEGDQANLGFLSFKHLIWSSLGQPWFRLKPQIQKNLNPLCGLCAHITLLCDRIDRITVSMRENRCFEPTNKTGSTPHRIM